jgi:transposase-like protein
MDLLDFVQEYFDDHDSGLKSLLTFFLNMVMEYEAEMQAGAARYQRSPTRRAYRNGKKPRTLMTRLGELTLSKPDFRNISFETTVFEKYSRVERAVINAILESYKEGVSTRKIQLIMNQLGIQGVSADTVSRMATELDEQVYEFLNRPIEQPITYLIVDATYLKVRIRSRYVNQAVLIIVGVRADGYREILGLKVAEQEDEGFWLSLFEDLKDRGLTGTQLVISDGHKGIRNAVIRAFTGASWQLCHVHFLRAIMRNLPRKAIPLVIPMVKEKMNGDEDELGLVAQELDKMGYLKAADTIERFLFDVGNYRAFPKSHWKRIRTTNMVERVNAEIKRRSRVVGAFPSSDSVVRLIGSILINMNEEWITGNRYLNMSEFECPSQDCEFIVSPVNTEVE